MTLIGRKVSTSVRVPRHLKAARSGFDGRNDLLGDLLINIGGFGGGSGHGLSFRLVKSTIALDAETTAALSSAERHEAGKNAVPRLQDQRSALNPKLGCLLRTRTVP